jgi:hypothetical protein
MGQPAGSKRDQSGAGSWPDRGQHVGYLAMRNVEYGKWNGPQNLIKPEMEERKVGHVAHFLACHQVAPVSHPLRPGRRETGAPLVTTGRLRSGGDLAQGLCLQHGINNACSKD